MTLDELYGEGFASAFALAVEGDVTEYPIPEGVRVYVAWSGGSMKIDCTPLNVHYLSLQSDRTQRYSDLCGALPALFKSVGVLTFTAAPKDGAAKAVLKRRGSWNDDGSRIVWAI